MYVKRKEDDMAKITIKDVAREAGVSIGTVSNALNEGRYINSDTKARVMEAVERLGYVPNLNGKYLKAGSTRMLGFFSNTLAGPYFCTLIDYLSRECWNKGYNLSVFATRETSVIMENLLGGRLDGAMIYEDTHITQSEIERMKKAGIKVVFLDREVCGEGISSIVFDSFKAGFDAAHHLLKLGHRRIAFIESVDDVHDSRLRKEGYLEALREYGIEPAPHYFIKGFFEEEATFNAIKTYMRVYPTDIPDAFLAGNDLSAMGCIKALKADGCRVPKDVSVMGFDDIDVAQYFTPPLTTVRNPIARQAVEAVDLLIDMIETKSQGIIRQLKGSIVTRESCDMR